MLARGVWRTSRAEPQAGAQWAAGQCPVETLCLPLGSCPIAGEQGGVFSPGSSSGPLTFLCKLHLGVFTFSCSFSCQCD